MKEILFRGKRVDNGEWVYGSYYHCCGTAYGATFIVVNDFGFIEVIPHTVGQYTGLTDKNGKRILAWALCQTCFASYTHSRTGAGVAPELCGGVGIEATDGQHFLPFITEPVGLRSC